MPLTGPQLVHAIKRNFGGLEESGVNPEKIFFDKLPKNIHDPPDLTTVDPHVNFVILIRNHFYVPHLDLGICMS